MRAQRTLLGVVLVSLAVVLGGCSGTTPRVSTGRLELGSQTDQGVVLNLVVLAENPNRDALPLGDVHYEVALGGTRVFKGTRSAQATLRRFGRHEIILPVALTREEWERLDSKGTAGTSDKDGGMASDDSSATRALDIPFRATGHVQYTPPGPLVSVLEDSGLWMPSVGFEVEGSFK